MVLVWFVWVCWLVNFKASRRSVFGVVRFRFCKFCQVCQTSSPIFPNAGTTRFLQGFCRVSVFRFSQCIRGKFKKTKPCKNSAKNPARLRVSKVRKSFLKPFFRVIFFQGCLPRSGFQVIFSCCLVRWRAIQFPHLSQPGLFAYGKTLQIQCIFSAG